MPHFGPYSNRLLSALIPEEREALAPHLELVNLDLGMPIEEEGRAIDYVYFVETGMISVVSKMNDRASVEVGMIGNEGVTGCAIAMGDNMPSNRTFVQIAGKGLRMPAAAFRDALHSLPGLKDLVIRYCRVLWIQAMSTALANAELELAARLARWLLMMHDRMDGNIIAITHEFLGMMLHSRRAGITVAIHILEGHHLINSKRGMLEIINRSGLIGLTHSHYGLPELEYHRLIGSLAAKSLPNVGRT